MSNKKKFLITGSSGFLGSVLKSGLQIDFEIDTLSNTADSTYNVDISANVPDITGEYHCVIHCAGKAHSVPKTKSEEQAFFDVNVQGTKNLCYAIESLEIKPAAFIFISTVAVYGVDEGNLISESHGLDGNTPYSKSKILAEEWLKVWAGRNNIILTILRLPLIAGPNPPGNLGAMINGIKHGKYLSIGAAKAQKSIVWAADIAAIIPKVAEIGGVYNLTDGYNPNLGEIEACIAGALKKKKPYRISTGTAKIMGYAGDIIGKRFPINSDKIKKLTATLTFDDSLAVNKLNWKPSPVLEKLASVI